MEWDESNIANLINSIVEKYPNEVEDFSSIRNIIDY